MKYLVFKILFHSKLLTNIGIFLMRLNHTNRMLPIHNKYFLGYLLLWKRMCVYISIYLHCLTKIIGHPFHASTFMLFPIKSCKIKAHLFSL